MANTTKAMILFSRIMDKANVTASHKSTYDEICAQNNQMCKRIHLPK